MMLLIILIVVLIALVIYICMRGISYYCQNPTYGVYNNKQSIVTHTQLGVKGDMGNQCIQIATLIALSKKYGAKIILPKRMKKLPIIELFDLTEFEWTYSSKDKSSVKVNRCFYEYNNYEEIEVPKDGKVYDIRGYRQCYKYFDDYGPEVRSIFTPRKEIIEAVKKVVPKKYLVVHIRRGDYLDFRKNIPMLEEFRKCKLNYYQSGIKKLREFYPDLPILVCTDSPKDVAKIIPTLGDDNISLAPTVPNISPKFTDFVVIYLAQGIVMSNSTFSWMASYLNPSPDRPVICPTPWWSSDGFIGNNDVGLALDGPYLHYPDWWLLNTDTGKVVREPNCLKGEKRDRQNEVLPLFKAIRGMFI